MPAWVWVALATPTITSAMLAIGWVALVAVRDWRYRRWRRSRPRHPLFAAGRPPRGTQNGGVRQPRNRATK